MCVCVMYVPDRYRTRSRPLPSQWFYSHFLCLLVVSFNKSPSLENLCFPLSSSLSPCPHSSLFPWLTLLSEDVDWWSPSFPFDPGLTRGGAVISGRSKCRRPLNLLSVLAVKTRQKTPVCYGWAVTHFGGWKDISYCLPVQGVMWLWSMKQQKNIFFVSVQFKFDQSERKK